MTLIPQTRVILEPVGLQLQLLLFFGLTGMSLKWQNYDWNKVKAAVITSEQQQQHKKSTELFPSQQKQQQRGSATKQAKRGGVSHSVVLLLLSDKLEGF